MLENDSRANAIVSIWYIKTFVLTNIAWEIVTSSRKLAKPLIYKRKYTPKLVLIGHYIREITRKKINEINDLHRPLYICQTHCIIAVLKVRFGLNTNWIVIRLTAKQMKHLFTGSLTGIQISYHFTYTRKHYVTSPYLQTTYWHQLFWGDDYQVTFTSTQVSPRDYYQVQTHHWFASDVLEKSDQGE